MTFWANKTSLIRPFFIKVSVPSQENERSFKCLLGVSILPIFLRFLIVLWNCSISLVFCFTLLVETGHWNRITTGRKWKKKPPTPLFIVIIINIWCNIHYQYISDAYTFFCILKLHNVNSIITVIYNIQN